MTQREIDIDDELLARAMEALGTSSVDETVNAVLRIAAKLDREPE
jgi:Arc/MetJ family transcription regulator